MYIVTNEITMASLAQDQTVGDHVIVLLKRGQSREDIEAWLITRGHDERFVKELVKEAKKNYETRRRAQGMMLIVCGAIICFTSFLLTVTSAFSFSNLPWVLYGLTSAGILLAFAGFTKIF